MIRKYFFITILASFSAFAEDIVSAPSLSSRLSAMLRTSLTEKIAGSEIRIPSFEKLIHQAPMSQFVEFKAAHLVADQSNGVAVFQVIGLNAQNQEISETVQTPYEAWKKVPVAIRRVYPNTKLKSEDFKVQEVNVASGVAREFRGVMISPDTNFDSLQSKQSILEGQYVVSSAVQKQPDLRKGEMVKLEMTSGELTLTTQATAQEAASVGDQIRVMTTKTKRELTGKVREDHSVEVTL